MFTEVSTSAHVRTGTIAEGDPYTTLREQRWTISGAAFAAVTGNR
jgi:hypothetical protein